MTIILKRIARFFIRYLAKLLTAIEAEKNPLRKREPLRNLHHELWVRAVRESADFVENYLAEALVFEEIEEIWDFAIRKIKEEYNSGVCLEFGVFEGYSINYFSSHLHQLEFHGFDSFEGLKEDWLGHQLQKGFFNLNGKIPSINKNVILHKGWFEDTLQPFIDNNKSTISFIHVDSDTYESAKFVLEKLLPYLEKQTLVLFDDYLSYPNWTNGEHKALNECKEKFGFSVNYIGFSKEQALIEIVKEF